MARVDQRKRKTLAEQDEVRRLRSRAGLGSAAAVTAAIPEVVVVAVQEKGRRTRRRTKSGVGSRLEDSSAQGSASPIGSSNSSGSGSTSSVVKDESIQKIKARLQEIEDSGDEAMMESYLLELAKDTRDAILILVSKMQAKMAAKATEALRLEELMVYERAIAQKVGALSLKETSKGSVREKNRKKSATSSSFYIVGVDEVGVGPLAGPIVSCAAAFQYDTLAEKLPSLTDIDDSKKLNVAKRERLSEYIKEECCASIGYGIVTAQEVDTLNPLQGSLIAMQRAVQSLNLPADCSVYLLVDHHTIPDIAQRDDRIVEQTSVTKGDSKSIAIAAASIVAKVYRDAYMTDLHERYPNFKFNQNAGYGTSDHLKELRKGLLCPEHRLSFAPVKSAHRKAQGLAPVAEQPKRKKRGSAASKGRISTSSSKSDSTMPTDIAAGSVSVSPAVTMQPGLLSMTWWTSWFSNSSNPAPPRTQIEQTHSS